MADEKKTPRQELYEAAFDFVTAHGEKYGYEDTFTAVELVKQSLGLQAWAYQQPEVEETPKK